MPKFEQARAKLECELNHCCLRTRSAFEHRIPQPPSPPGFEADRVRLFALIARMVLSSSGRLVVGPFCFPRARIVAPGCHRRNITARAAAAPADQPTLAFCDVTAYHAGRCARRHRPVTDGQEIACGRSRFRKCCGRDMLNPSLSLIDPYRLNRLRRTRSSAAHLGAAR